MDVVSLLCTFPHRTCSVRWTELGMRNSECCTFKFKCRQPTFTVIWVSCWHLTMEDHFQSQDSPSGICGVQTGIATGFSPYTLAFVCQLLHQCSTNISFIYHLHCMILAINSAIT